jgi:hypothetical protein
VFDKLKSGGIQSVLISVRPSVSVSDDDLRIRVVANIHLNSLAKVSLVL